MPKRDLTGVQLTGHLPVLEHARNGHAGKQWRLWLSYNNTYTVGVYLTLHEDGKIVRTSFGLDGVTNTAIIRPSDGKHK